MPNSETIVLPEGTSPERLDVYLTQRLDLSRSQIQKNLKSGIISLNGKTAKAHHTVKAGDTIAIAMDVPVHEFRPKKDMPDPEVIYEDGNYLVVNKPSGLVMHGGPGVHEPTLADWSVAHDPVIAEVGDQPDVRPGIVHRLDRDVSGLVVVAKTQAAFEDLKKQFQQHSITKQYIALAHGRVTDEQGRINFAIARKPDKSGLMVARPKSTEGKAAETLFNVDRFVKNMTLLKVQTLTGRTHQIRVHFKAIGHPLVGDPLYKARKLKQEKIEAPRIFLHAAHLEFDTLDGERKSFHVDLPADLQHFLSKLH